MHCLTDGLSCTAPATATACFDAIFLQVCPIGVARTRVEVHGAVAVILRPLVLVHDPHANGRSQRDAKLGAGLDFHTILLVARGGDCALARPTAGHLGLDVGLGELHARRAAVDNATDGEAV